MLNRNIISDNEGDEGSSTSELWQFSPPNDAQAVEDSYLMYNPSSDDDDEARRPPITIRHGGILIVDNEDDSHHHQGDTTSPASASQLSYPDSLPTDIVSIQSDLLVVAPKLKVYRRMVGILLGLLVLIAATAGLVARDRYYLMSRVQMLERQLEQATQDLNACSSQVVPEDPSTSGGGFEWEHESENESSERILADNCWFKLSLGNCGENAKQCFSENSKKFQDWWYNEDEDGILQASVEQSLEEATEAVAGAAVMVMDSMVWLSRTLDEYTTDAVAMAMDVTRTAVQDASPQLAAATTTGAV